MRKIHLMGSYHTDLAWRGDEKQYADYLEQFVVILMDILEQNPEMTYTIEQAYHYRSLQKRRPDLIKKLTKLIADGRVEVMGGMMSTLDTNVPGMESLVRNQLMGLRWFKENMDAEPKTGWLLDAFGLNAQLPQILASFGMKQMFGSRFGGEMPYDVFWAEGLDGTKMLTAGRDCFSPNLPGPERSRILFECCTDGEKTDEFFCNARKNTLDGSVMVNFFTEDEVYPGRRYVEHVYSLRNDLREHGDEAEFSLPYKFFDDLRQETDFPTVSADLNPEFTGCFAQRMEIRLQNRKAENAMLEAEKWSALLQKEWPKELREAWWDLAFVHFHDVFTGSHPEKVYKDVISRIQKAQSLAERKLEQTFGLDAKEDGSVQVVNSLPFARSEWVCIPCRDNKAVIGTPSYRADGHLYFRADIGPLSSAVFEMDECAGENEAFVPQSGYAELENEYIRLIVDSDKGVSLVSKETGCMILDHVRDLLILQGDTGSFQVERIETPEQYAWTDDVHVVQTDEYTIRACGAFRSADRIEAEWTLFFRLRPGEKAVGLQIETAWQAIGKRLRLKLNTTMHRAGDTINEIPFGVIRRRAYTPAFSRKGEWPVQRFAAIEDRDNGIALINDGAPGVEALGGSLYTTLLRAPTQVYAGMVPDDSSQQHGMHTFRFAVLPYAGLWQDSGVLRYAQTHNSPLRLFAAEGKAEPMKSLFSVDNPAVVLSTVKPAEDECRNDIVIRLYESTGREQECKVKLAGMKKAWIANMAEERMEELAVEDGCVLLRFKPWQIVTLCAERT
ncbi:MAG: hypothetical protein IJC54_01685 [Clostridia bacterium]|nr:hypothetical protein [Clostridia bacterium]